MSSYNESRTQWVTAISKHLGEAETLLNLKLSKVKAYLENLFVLQLDNAAVAASQSIVNSINLDKDIEAWVNSKKTEVWTNKARRLELGKSEVRLFFFSS